MAQRRNKPDGEYTPEEVVKSVEQKPRWKVLSGGITLLDKRYFEKGQTFEAWDHEVPMAFRDIVQCLDVVNAVPARPKNTYSLVEIVPTAEEEDDENYVPLYNIENQMGKVISKGLTKEVAEPLVKELNK